MQWFDDFFEARSRRAAQSISRRSAISRMGKLLVGTAFLLPILPFDRIGKAVAATKAMETTTTPPANTGAIARSTVFSAPAAAARFPPAHRAPKFPRSPGSAPATIRTTARTT